MAYMHWKVDEKSAEHKAKKELIEKNISFFNERCINREVSYSLHRDCEEPARELIEESRFADVLVNVTMLAHL